MSDLIGVENLIPNPSADGDGLHQTTTGGFLTPDTNSDQSAGKVLGFGDRFFQRRRKGP